MPPDYLQPLLHSIEEVVVNIYNEFPKLGGPDIEWVYEKLLNYFKVLASGKEAEEPFSNSDMKLSLVEEILNIIDVREELNADLHLINNPDIRQGEHTITSLPALYVIAFKTVLKSAIYWRKENGRNGYIRFIIPFIRPSSFGGPTIE